VRDNVLSNNKVTDYANGFQYLDNVIQHFPTAEGYASRLNLRQENGVVALLPSTELPVDFFTYVYNYTDHLGNIRLSYAQDPDTQQLKIVEQNHYYPFGLRHTNYSGGKMQVVKEQELKRMAPTPEELLSYKYKFGGNEFQDEIGLNVYDYDNRIYDQALGRFWQMDPLAEQGRRWSPYNYCFDNPVFFQDPDGMWPKIPSWSDIKKTYNEAKASVVKTYNQAKAKVVKTYNEVKATVTKTYNEAKTTVTKAYNETKKAVVETASKTQEWVKENKVQIISLAKEIQDVGDKTTTTGLVAAAAGAPLAGIGASPGLTVATAGGALSTIGELLEIGTNFIAGDISEGTGSAAVYITGKLAEMAVDRAVPGPNPNVAPKVEELIKATNETVKNLTSEKTKDLANQIRQ